MTGLLILVGVLVVVLIVVAVVAAQKGRLTTAGVEEDLPFEACRDLFSPAERSFFGVLEQVVGDEFKVFGKVRLGDLIKPAKGLSQSRRASLRNRIQLKHIDFVLCRPDTLEVAAVM
jgi:hypothetical protein